jgi:predicted permease
VLAIGIGANTAVFSVVNTMLLKPLAAPQPGRVVQLMRRNQRFDLYCVAVADLFAWRAQTQILEDVAAYSYVPDKLSLTGGDTPEQISAEHVSRDYFRLFGARTAVGRVFTAEEDRPGAGNFAVLGAGLWQRWYGSDPNVAGKTILLGGDPYTVVGVLDVSFQGDRSVDLWLPLQADPASTAGCSLWGAGRLKAGVTLAQAQTALRLAADEYKRSHSAHTTFLGEAAMPTEVTYTAEPMERIITSDIRPALYVLLVAVACVLLIGCANITGLLLVSGVRRSREIAIRSALGASRRRIVRQLLVESLVLSLAGGVFGLLVGVLVIKLLPPLEPMNVARIGPGARPFALDSAVLAVAAFLSILTSVLCGLLPALQASRADLFQQLKYHRTR